MDDAKHIFYDPKYSVHIEEIDAQHKELFSIVNRVVDLSESESGDLLPILNDLIEYLSYHFHTESMHMKAMEYPGLYGHIKEHDQFTRKIQSFIDGYKNQDRNLTIRMVLFLREWVWSHTTGIDIKYAEHFAKTQN